MADPRSCGVSILQGPVPRSAFPAISEKNVCGIRVKLHDIYDKTTRYVIYHERHVL